MKKENHQFVHFVEKNFQDHQGQNAKNVEQNFNFLMDPMDHMDHMDHLHQVNIMDLMDHHQKLNVKIVEKNLNFLKDQNIKDEKN